MLPVLFCFSSMMMAYIQLLTIAASMHQRNAIVAWKINNCWPSASHVLNGGVISMEY